MSRHHAALDARRWARARRAALERDGWRCTACGRPGRLEVHHAEALEDGGEPYALSNLRTLCRGCHAEHHRPPVPPAVAAWRALVDDLSRRA